MKTAKLDTNVMPAGGCGMGAFKVDDIEGNYSGGIPDFQGALKFWDIQKYIEGLCHLLHNPLLQRQGFDNGDVKKS